ncbi:unnamed protein product [Linum trigynum]|uniref:Uncharacterized protein n=2 Tax=Linum trigynum TaxID=586398 RepID=A0AAV2EDA9_9ROSI
MASSSSIRQTDNTVPLSPANNKHVFGGDEDIHPEIVSALFLAPWLILGVIGDTWSVIAFMRTINLESKLGTGACYAIALAVELVSLFSFIPWCFPHELPRLGSARKIILEMVVLQAAMLAKHFPQPHQDHSLVYQLLVALTILVCVRTKHGFVFMDVYFGDVFWAIVAESLIYWTPLWGSVLFYLCFVGYIFWTSGENNTTGGDGQSSADQVPIPKAIEENLATQEVSSKQKEEDVQLMQQKESEQIIVAIVTPNS